MSHGTDRAATAVARGAAASRKRLEVISRDPASKQVLQHVERIAPSSASVLIVGESGTGKELIARHVHERSGRRGPFVAVNCGALTPALAEAELFGHEAGAFTGASGQRVGWFEAANGGTLLLDEISELPAELQVKILRVLQEREVTRVGSRHARSLDVRLIAATNVDLAQAVADGRFRADLFYRLNVATIALAPLRQRRADIVPLAEQFLAVHAARLRASTPQLLPETKEALLEYAWPGNIRELDNVMQSSLLASSDGAIRPQHLRLRQAPARPQSVASRGATADDTALGALAAPLERLLQSAPSQLFPRVEEFLVRRAWSHCRGNQVLAARLLGVPRNVMRTQLQRYGLIESGAGRTNDFLAPDSGQLHQAAG